MIKKTLDLRQGDSGFNYGTLLQSGNPFSLFPCLRTPDIFSGMSSATKMYCSIISIICFTTAKGNRKAVYNEI